MRSKLLLAAIAVLTPAAIAQGPSAKHAVTLPDMYTGSFAGSGNAFPLARTKGFIQYYMHAPSIGLVSPVVRQLGWRRAMTNTTSAAYVGTFEIKLGVAANDFANLSKTFTANFAGKPTDFFLLKKVNVPGFTTAPTDPDKPAFWITGDRPYIHTIGKALIIQVDIQTETTPRSLSGWTTDSILSGRSGISKQTDTSCGGTISASHASNSITLGVSGTDPNSPLLYMIGLRTLAPNDIGALIGPGCTFVISPDIPIGVAADASGANSITFPAAIRATDSIGVHFQAIHLKSNKLASTNAAHLWIGTAGAMNYVYNWTVFSATAQYGPYTTNRGPVVLLR